MPCHIIDQPEQIPKTDIDLASDIQVRRCMIDRLTPERYVAFGDALRVSEDETGILWERRWVDGDTWAAVEVLNGTPRAGWDAQALFLAGAAPNVQSARSRSVDLWINRTPVSRANFEDLIFSAVSLALTRWPP